MNSTKTYDTRRWAATTPLPGAQYATGVEWRVITNSSRKNEAAGPKQKWHSVVDVFGAESKEQYCMGT